MNDPTQLAALAALVGITPETHGHLWQHTVWYEPNEGDWYPMWYVMENAVKFRFTGPALDTPAGDDVFLAPLMRWLKLCGYWPKMFFDGEHWNGVIGTEKRNAGHMETMTAALLRACLAAGVPEIVAIFGEGEHA
jgi:hypothetical protein